MQLEVSDTGCGMPTDLQAKVFDPFFTTKSAGRGLGLSIVAGIVRDLGGAIHLTSEPGKGSTFQVLLPCAETATAREDKIPGFAQPTRTGQPATILVVEDEAGIRALVRKILHRQGYEVLEAASGDEALALSHEYPSNIDMLITDVVMPKMDGPGLVREVRETHPEMKVIFISGYTEDSFRQHLDSDSNIHFLPKPFSLKQLATKVKEVISGEAA